MTMDNFFEKMSLNAQIYFSALNCANQMISSERERLGQMVFHWVTVNQVEMVYKDRETEKRLLLQSGDFVILPSVFEHQLRFTEEINESRGSQEREGSGILCAAVTSTVPGFKAWLEQMPDLILIRSGEWNQQISQMVLGEQKRLEGQPGKRAVINKLAEIAFVCAMREYLRKGEDLGAFVLLTDKQWSGLVQRVMADPAENWSVTKMAEICHMSRANFARRFKEDSGWTPARMVLWFRMQKAYELVKEGMGTGEVSMRCGYESETAFIRAFVKEYQKTPAQLKRSALNSKTYIKSDISF